MGSCTPMATSMSYRMSLALQGDASRQMYLASCMSHILQQRSFVLMHDYSRSGSTVYGVSCCSRMQSCKMPRLWQCTACLIKPMQRWNANVSAWHTQSSALTHIHRATKCCAHIDWPHLKQGPAAFVWLLSAHVGHGEAVNLSSLIKDFGHGFLICLLCCYVHICACHNHACWGLLCVT